MVVKAELSDRFQEVVRSAASQLVSVELVGGGSYVTTPLLYASGSYVVVRVEKHGDQYFVTDFGSGFEEAQMMGGDNIYRRSAKNIAEVNGVDFDNFAFFALLVSEGQIPSAIATIANSAQEAVNVTAMKIAEKKYSDENEVLFDRLASIFSPKMIARNAIVMGASNTEWHVASLVTVDGRNVAFEAVSKHPNSVVFAAAKFGDIARIEHPPSRVAVVANKKLLGTYLGVLTHTASVIEREVENRVYQRLVSEAAA